MTARRHALRVFLLMIAAAAFFVGLSGRAEVTFSRGLRSIRQAERIDRGEWRKGVLESSDHPLHPLAIIAAHRVLGGEGPISWRRAAQAAAILTMISLVIPLYLLGLELYDPATAWMGCVLFLGNATVGYVVVNVLSETTFLLFWTWGLWFAVRYLRDERPGSLWGAVAFGATAYLARPEGALLFLALAAVLAIVQWHWAMRFASWPKWCGAAGIVMVGALALLGPFVAAKGELGTTASVARAIGTAPESPPDAVERDKPTPPDQSAFTTYLRAIVRAYRVCRDMVGLALLPLALSGVILTIPELSRMRPWIFLTTVFAASAAVLVRLHATSGYCDARHALVPGMILVLAAAHGLGWFLRSVVIDGRWIGKPANNYHLGPVVYAAVMVVLIAAPYHSRLRTSTPGGFGPYQQAGAWLASNAKGQGRVLDMTDWSLFYSERSGYGFNEVDRATADPATRWVVVRQGHIQGRRHHAVVLRELLAGLEPAACFPEHPGPGRLQVRVYDRDARGVPNLATRPGSSAR